MQAKRVAITGMGIISCLGNSTTEVLCALRGGRSGVELIPQRKELQFRSCLAGTIKNFQRPEMPKRNARSMGENGYMAVAAVRQAIADAALDEDMIRNDRTGVLVGTIASFHEIFENCYAVHTLKKRLNSGAAARGMGSGISANLSVLFGTRGHCMNVSTACASGTNAIGQAAWAIRLGLQDRMIAGGVEESSWELSCHVDSPRVFSTRDDQPTEASRPFDKSRDGLIPSAGAGFVVLEEYEQAIARRANIYAELVGYGTNSDGTDMYIPSKTGAIQCMQLALADAQLRPDQIDYINAHGTSTPAGDAMEAQGILQIFGARPYVSSTKSMTGHELAAAGSNELVYTLLMIKHGFIAPNINVEEIGEDCQGINLVANHAIDAKIDVAMSNSFGFGGVNACLIVSTSPSCTNAATPTD